MIYGQLISALRTFQQLTDIVGRNKQYKATAEQYVIRAGQLDEDDPFPGIVIALPNTEIEGGLDFRGGLATSTVEVRAISLSLAESWALTRAAAWNGGTVDDPTRVLSGLDGYRDLSKGLQASRLLTIVEEPIATEDKSDRLLWLVEATYEISFDVGTMLALEN